MIDLDHIKFFRQKSVNNISNDLDRSRSNQCLILIDLDHLSTLRSLGFDIDRSRSFYPAIRSLSTERK